MKNFFVCASCPRSPYFAFAFSPRGICCAFGFRAVGFAALALVAPLMALYGVFSFAPCLGTGFIYSRRVGSLWGLWWLAVARLCVVVSVYVFLLFVACSGFCGLW